jgi:hypothetical protein
MKKLQIWGNSLETVNFYFRLNLKSLPIKFLTKPLLGNIFPIMEAINGSISSAVVKMLRPLIRILLRNGLPYGAFADLAKGVYVSVAFEESGIRGKKPSTSRVSIITGLSRKEVNRVKNLPDHDDPGASDRYNRAARVISGWTRDSAYTDQDGNPLDLPIEGAVSTFSQLVKQYSGDVPHRAILDELVRVGAVQRTSDNRVRLLTNAYVPRTGDVEKIEILGTDAADLISTIDHNLQNGSMDPFFQRKVSYDNLPSEAINDIRMLARENGQKLLEHLDGRISQVDRDINPEVHGTGRMRAGVGIYYFEEGKKEDSENEE